MISCEDFRKEDGQVDWEAYKKARIEVGEKCCRCGAYITFPWGVKDLCWSCKTLDQAPLEEVTHSNLIRCPSCGHNSDVTQWDCDYRNIYQEGEHEVECDACNHRFQISTWVDYHFVSPPRK